MEKQMAFPVIGLLDEETQGHRYNEGFLLFFSSPDLHLATLSELRRGKRTKMLLIDNAGRAWAVRKVWSTGPRTRLWTRVLQTVFGQGGDIEHIVDYELEDRDPRPFTEVQDHVCRSIDRNPYDWVDDEAVAGEAGPPVNLEDALEVIKMAVRQAANVQELSDGLEVAFSSRP